MDPKLIAVVDIGSPIGDKLGWATSSGSEGVRDLDPLLHEVAEALKTGPVALGFECPLWIPARTNLSNVLQQRVGENGRAWSAGAGANSLCAGLGVIQYFLSTLRCLAPTASATLDFRSPLQSPGELFLFEAFVSRLDKVGSHCDDARSVVDGFSNLSRDVSTAQRLLVEPSPNLLGALLLRTGWSKELSLLEAEMLVLDHRQRVSPRP